MTRLFAVPSELSNITAAVVAALMIFWFEPVAVSLNPTVVVPVALARFKVPMFPDASTLPRRTVSTELIVGAIVVAPPNEVIRAIKTSIPKPPAMLSNEFNVPLSPFAAAAAIVPL